MFHVAEVKAWVYMTLVRASLLSSDIASVYNEDFSPSYSLVGWRFTFLIVILSGVLRNHPLKVVT